ncbi:MAG: nicotinate (nicotinamide) nucleotide adenylyltransferase [Planctomycetota bacterium]|nr:nicotinate (nicotinamide) nucleotide adenylyltransferase [Planctomycetota bacterium]
MTLPHAELAQGARAARRLGLLGGSFDPPHAGHTHAARAAAAAFELDHVVFVPAARPPHKLDRVMTAAEHRLAMLELFVAGEPGWSIWSGELSRDGPSYSVDTARAVAVELPGVELFWILGSDNLAGLPTWHRAEELVRLARPIVILRRGDPPRLEATGALSEVARARIAAGLVEVDPIAESSSAVREHLAAGRDPGPGLPGPVREYAARKGIYRGS